MSGQVNISVPTLGDKFQDYRIDVYGNSFNFGPVILAPNVQFLTIHHSVTPALCGKEIKKIVGGKEITVIATWKDEVDYIAKLHVNGNGWAGIGYHFVGCSDGTVAYVQDLSHGGANVYLHNDINFGYCMVGDFTKHLPTDEQITSVHKFAWHMLSMPQYPALLIKDPSEFDKHVRGHKDWCNKETGDNCTLCPGSSWPSDMKYRIKYGVVYTPQPKVEEQPKENVIISDTQPVQPAVVVETNIPPIEQSTPQETEEIIIVEPEKNEVVEAPIVEPVEESQNSNVTPPISPHNEVVYEKPPMRHVDYLFAMFKFIIKIFNKKII